MALIDVSVKIQGTADVTAVPVRIISATAELRGASATDVGRPPARPHGLEPKKTGV
jgi:hypothetical protein